MVNTAQQGARLERKVILDLAEYGYDCIRSAASKGAVDVVAVPSLWTCPDGCGEVGAGHVLFIQCKLSNPLLSPAERLAVQDLALRAGALPLVAWWAKSDITGLMAVHYRQLTGPGPKDWAPWAPGEDN